MVADLAQSWLTRSAPVAAAQAAGRPLVALESTIIAHGMPYPENVRTAREVEAVIRDTGRRARDDRADRRADPHRPFG